ncbi:hypothetical protein ACQP2Y_07335 [Actinoplanes sp. CA-051413]|uniref:hypothetical protein n=1 Tax=Actinoplanes sp. CA-051413 TaxID=3239899 RepID=UPI003D97BAE2
MFYIHIDQGEATAMIAAAAAHLPIGASLGRIMAVTSAGILTEAAMYGVDAEMNRTWRMVDTAGGRCEFTAWRDGAEVARYLMAPQPAE